MKKTKLPLTKRNFNELRLISKKNTSFYEDSKYFFSDHYTEITTYTKLKENETEYLSQEILYHKNGVLKSRKTWNKKGTLLKHEKCEVENNKLIVQSKDNETIWQFEENGKLTKATYKSKKKAEKQITFQYNKQQNLIGINGNIKIEWKQETPYLAKDSISNKILTHIVKRTKTESNILYPQSTNKNRTNTPRIISYNKYDRLIKDEMGDWLKSFSYFGYDMMNGKRIIQYFKGKQMWQFHEEETLIKRGLIEVKSYYQQKENSNKTHYRILNKYNNIEQR